MVPLHQVCTGEPGAAPLPVEPATAVGPRALRRHAGLQAGEGMGALAREADGMMHLGGDRLDELAPPGQPPAHTCGPGMSALPLRRAQHLGPIAGPPAHMSRLSLEA